MRPSPRRLLALLVRAGRRYLQPLAELLLELLASGPSIELAQVAIARELGVSVRTVRRHELELEALGLIDVDHGRYRNGRRLRWKTVESVCTTGECGHERPVSPHARPAQEATRMIGTRAYSDPESRTYRPLQLHVARPSCGQPESTPDVAHRQLRRAAALWFRSSGLWSNALREAVAMVDRLAERDGPHWTRRWIERLHSWNEERFPITARGRLAMGALRKRAGVPRTGRLFT